MNIVSELPDKTQLMYTQSKVSAWNENPLANQGLEITFLNEYGIDIESTLITAL